MNEKTKYVEPVFVNDYVATSDETLDQDNETSALNSLALLIILIVDWGFFLILSLIFRKSDRLLSVGDSVASVESLSGDSIKKGIKTIIVRIRFITSSPKCQHPDQTSLIFRFFHLKQKVATLVVPFKSMVDKCFTFKRGDNRYQAIIFEWRTFHPLSQVDSVKVGFTSPDEMELIIRDLDLRSPQAKLRYHFKIESSVRSFPVLSVTGSFYVGTSLSVKCPDDFSHPIEQITRREAILFMYFQQMLSLLISEAWQLDLQTSGPQVASIIIKGFAAGIVSSIIAFLFALGVINGYMLTKQYLSPLRFERYELYHIMYQTIVLLLGIACGLGISVKSYLKGPMRPYFSLVTNFVSLACNGATTFVWYKYYLSTFYIEKGSGEDRRKSVIPTQFPNFNA